MASMCFSQWCWQGSTAKSWENRKQHNKENNETNWWLINWFFIVLFSLLFSSRLMMNNETNKINWIHLDWSRSNHGHNDSAAAPEPKSSAGITAARKKASCATAWYPSDDSLVAQAFQESDSPWVASGYREFPSRGKGIWPATAGERFQPWSWAATPNGFPGTFRIPEWVISE